MRDESLLRRPAVGECRFAIAGPVPIRPFVQVCCGPPDFRLVGCVPVKVCCHRQGAREKECGINGGQFALPDPAPGLNVEEMVEEALVAGGIRLRALRALCEVAKPFASNLCRE